MRITHKKQCKWTVSTWNAIKQYGYVAQVIPAANMHRLNTKSFHCSPHGNVNVEFWCYMNNAIWFKTKYCWTSMYWGADCKASMTIYRLNRLTNHWKTSAEMRMNQKPNHIQFIFLFITCTYSVAKYPVSIYNHENSCSIVKYEFFKKNNPANLREFSYFFVSITYTTYIGCFFTNILFSQKNFWKPKKCFIIFHRVTVNRIEMAIWNSLMSFFCSTRQKINK